MPRRPCNPAFAAARFIRMLSAKKSNGSPGISSTAEIIAARVTSALFMIATLFAAAAAALQERVSPSISSRTRLVWLPSITARAALLTPKTFTSICRPWCSFKLMATLSPANIESAADNNAGVIRLSTDNSSAGSLIRAPSAAAIPSPTFPVPGMPTATPFLYTFESTQTSTFCGASSPKA